MRFKISPAYQLQKANYEDRLEELQVAINRFLAENQEKAALELKTLRQKRVVLANGFKIKVFKLTYRDKLARYRTYWPQTGSSLILMDGQLRLKVVTGEAKLEAIVVAGFDFLVDGLIKASVRAS